MFPTHFTGVYIEIQYWAIHKAHSVPEMNGHTGNPNGSFKKLSEKWWDAEKDARARPLL